MSDDQTQFLQQLAQDLNSRDIKLPSFPDVVINIRTALEDPTCSSERLGDVVRTDPVLVARLLIAANSAYHNRAGIEIVDLNLAISRLGFEVVRNTAITLAVEQLFNATEYEDLRESMQAIWQGSLSMASMSFVIAQKAQGINSDNAFLGGLLHDIGKLYILTRARQFPNLMGEEATLNSLLEQWTPSVGRSIVESWGFAEEIAESIEAADNVVDDSGSPATLVDVVHAADTVLGLADGEQQIPDSPSLAKLTINIETLPAIREAFDLHAQSMRQSAGG
ncbi:MAG: HDOD domain-containing protein [Pseudomonadota bacterium]